jgi:hypothetical protein
VNRVNQTVRNWRPHSSGFIEATGLLHAHRFSKGSRLRIEITNLDLDTGPDWGTAPFVLPMFSRTSATLYTDSVRASFIEFPFEGDPLLTTKITNLTAVYDNTARCARIGWRTLSESGNAGFWIMKKQTGFPESAAGFLPPQSGPNSGLPVAYTFVDSAIRDGSWSYWLVQVARDSSVQKTASVQVNVGLTGIQGAAPLSFSLDQNYPNPFNPSTTISFSLPRQSRVLLKIYTLLGQEAETLIDAVLPPGRYSDVWNAGQFRSGTYFCRLTVGQKTFIRRMILLK